jgi:hypothetical protein
MEDFNVDKAKKDELFTHAREVLGLEVTTANTAEELRTAIKLALGMPVEEVKVETPKKDRDKWPVIQISPSERDSGDVQIGVNGKIFLIQRGKEVAVPPEVLEVLKHATSTIYPDPKTMKPVERQRYPFSVIKQAG